MFAILKLFYHINTIFMIIWITSLAHPSWEMHTPFEKCTPPKTQSRGKLKLYQSRSYHFDIERYDVDTVINRITDYKVFLVFNALRLP